LAQSDFSALGLIFHSHIVEFAGFKDFAAFQALDELGLFVAAHQLHARMLARSLVGSRERFRRLGWTHKSGRTARSPKKGEARFSPQFPGIVDRLMALSSPSVARRLISGRSRVVG
jgi:hypothetical protein